MGMTTLPQGISIGFGPAPVDGQDSNPNVNPYDTTQLNNLDPSAQQMPSPIDGLPTVGMGGGKSGSLPPGVGIGMPGQIFMPSQDSLAAQSPVPSQNPPVAQPIVQPPMAQFPGQQQPITQGTGQLPPGFGNLSPVDRSQIAPNAGVGFGPAMQPFANRFAPPNAPGVRPASMVSAANQMNPRTVTAPNAAPTVGRTPAMTASPYIRARARR
jgi:hypothetical protein